MSKQIKFTNSPAYFILVFPIILALLLAFPFGASAKRRLPRAGGKKPAAAKPRAKLIKVKFRPDRRAIIAEFTSAANIRRIDYALTYSTKGKREAATGSISPSFESSAVRELVFGTASGGVYTYHTSITDARFTVTTTLINGTKYIKPFKLKL